MTKSQLLIKSNSKSALYSVIKEYEYLKDKITHLQK